MMKPAKTRATDPAVRLAVFDSFGRADDDDGVEEETAGVDCIRPRRRASRLVK